MPSKPGAPRLAATRIAATDHPDRNLVMLHGIYGRGRNWQGIARALAAERPEYACWLVDLPYHGESGPGAHGDNVVGLAQDVDDWLATEGITPDAILGHSYGGKVALAIAARRPSQPLQVWVIDSTPEIKQPSGSAWQMLEIIRGLPSRFTSRDEAVAAIVRGGFPLGVAQWMGTNLAREGDAFVWRLDFEAMDRLLHDFFNTDLWPVIEDPSPLHDLHFLKASESSALSAEGVARLDAVTGPHIHLHHREGGHWIHAESPDVVTALLIDHLP
jgi:pimeloyl-ACP methyl ester carboxylesterase